MMEKSFKPDLGTRFKVLLVDIEAWVKYQLAGVLSNAVDFAAEYISTSYLRGHGDVMEGLKAEDQKKAQGEKNTPFRLFKLKANSAARVSPEDDSAHKGPSQNQ